MCLENGEWFEKPEGGGDLHIRVLEIWFKVAFGGFDFVDSKFI